MRDLLLFSLLLQRQWDDPRLEELLGAFAGLSLRDRAPYFGMLLEVLEEGPTHLRARALRGLAGAEGFAAVRDVVRALDDDATREAAITALRRAAEAHPARWAHAVFHPDERVRLAALTEGTPEQAKHLEIHWLADDACRERVLSGDLTLGPSGVGTVIDLVRRGVLDPPRARKLLSKVDFTEWLGASRARSDEVITRYLASAARPEGPDASVVERAEDDLDDLFALFWTDEDEAFEKLARTAFSTFEGMSRRAAAALVSVAEKRRWLPSALLMLLRLHLEAITFEYVARTSRVRAAMGLFEHEGDLDRDEDTIRAILWSPACTHPEGGPDLAVIGAVLSRLDEYPYRPAREWIGSATIVATLALRPEASAPFLFALDGTDAERLKLLAQVPSTRATRRILETFARDAPLARLTMLASCERFDVLAIATELATATITHTRAVALAQVLSEKLGPEGVMQALASWRGVRRSSQEGDLAVALVMASAREQPADAWSAAANESSALPFVLDLIDREPAFPYAKEMALAARLHGSDNAALRAWAEKRAVTPAPKQAPPPLLPKSDLAKLVATCRVSELASHLSPFTSPPREGRSGLAELLARRTDHAPNATVCVALLASDDPAESTDAILARYWSDDPTFLSSIEHELVRRFGGGETPISTLGHAWLWRFERHAERAVARLRHAHGDLGHALVAASALTLPPSRAHVFATVARWIALASSRDRPAFLAAVTPSLAAALAEGLTRTEGPWAADALVALLRSGQAAALLADTLPRVRLLLPEVSAETRDRLSRWVDAEGLDTPREKPLRVPLPADELSRVRGSTDLDDLERSAETGGPALVHEAAVRLLVLGEEGRARLLAVLARATDATRARPIAESLPLWDPGDALTGARALASRADAPAELRFRLALGFLERGDAAARDVALACALEPSPGDKWFEQEDWARLLRQDGDEQSISRALAPSPHPHAYVRAVSTLLAGGAGESAAAALRDFLDAGTGRMGSLRRTAASWLHARGDLHAFPLVMQQELDASKGTSTLLSAASPRLVEITTYAFLAAGNVVAKEASLLFHLSGSAVDPLAREVATEIVLTTATSDVVRSKAASRLRDAFGLNRLRKLHRVATTFAWGVRTARDLVGKQFRVQMTGGQSLGHTRLNERRLYVTPLPLLRGDQHGKEIVEALILHELGHHMYHRGGGAEAVWAEAQKEGLHGLLNLVADEHLERNLRAIDAAYGDRLKRLAAYAFQHTTREIQLARLLGHLGGRAFDVLVKTHLGVAKDDASVVVESGALLGMMERQGLAFSRFVRALRMGLGNRHEDPRVARALTLFSGRFRHSSMQDLMRITRELKSIFGWETQLCESFGPHESLEAGESEGIIWGEGITQEEVEREVERVLDPKSNEGDRSGVSGPPGKPWLNVNPKNTFDPITSVEKQAFDPAAAAALAARVQRPAALMRRFLEELGLALLPQRLRLSGFRLDKTRITPLVLRGDPRALLARTREPKSDLFLGITVDCSGSMSSRDNMERARLFAALLGEAAKGLRGVDFRAFGFTDKVIYDCGDGARNASHALRAGGGNNDAAALFHLAKVAKMSRRKAKLLVMISDGLPTECTVAALRELVTTLTVREKMVCAQAAVQPLAEVCFPNYVVLNDASIEATVMKFGKVVARLVQKAMGGS